MKPTETPLAERISKGLAAITSANVVGVALKGLSILVLARFLLSPEEYGLLFLALSVVTFTQLFTDLGIARSAARYVSEYQETDAGQVPHIIRTALTYNLATIGVVGAVLLAFDDQIAGLVDQPSIAPFVAIGAVYVAARSLTVFSRRLFQGLNRVTYSALVTALTRGGEFVFVVGLAVLTGEVMGAFLGFVVSYVLAALVGGAVLYRRFYSRFPKAPAMEPGLARRLFEYNLPLTTTKGAGQLLSKTDIVLLGYFWNPVVVGVYTLGLQIAEFIATPAASLGFVISPTFGEHKANDDLGTAARIYQESFRHTLLLYVPGAVGLFVVADPAIRLIFGADYANAIPVVKLLALFVVLKAVNAITNTALDYLGKARLRAYAKVGGAALNVVLNVALVPVFGAVGAAAATIATYGLLVGVNLALVARTLPLSVARLGRTVVQVGLVAAVMGAVVVPTVPYVSGLVTLGAVVGLGVLVWGVLAVASGLLEPDQVRAVLAS